MNRIQAMAKEKGVAASQLALAWVMARGDDIVPIPGTKRKKYLEENARAAEITLIAEALERLDEAAPHGVAAGTRYAEVEMRSVNH